MSNFDIRDEVTSALLQCEQILKQLTYNHMDLHVKDDNMLSKLEEYGYGRLFSCNYALIDIAAKIVDKARGLVESFAV